ncbi:MAG: hypothetical protein ACRDHU_02955 [Actinomycetota bacterium]
MGAGAISLLLDRSGESGAFAFTCPECSTDVNKPASRKTVALLIAAGVEPVERNELVDSIDWTFPIEDQSPDPNAAAFSMDDVIAFHFLLENGSAIEDFFSYEH